MVIPIGSVKDVMHFSKRNVPGIWLKLEQLRHRVPDLEPEHLGWRSISLEFL
jgi:hypothetical protein